VAVQQREASFDPGVPHPEFLELGGHLALVRVDHPVLRPVFHGAPDLGWEGDHRLAVYSWPARNSFVLVRLERDGEYSIVTAQQSVQMLSPGDVNRMIRWLVSHDATKGFDAAKAVLEADARAEAAAEQRVAEWAEEEMAPRLAWALQRDIGQHMGGTKQIIALNGRKGH
jgi:hypothetical protein